MKQNERRRQIMAYIRTYAAGHGGQTPSTREIAQACGLKSHSVVLFHLRKLAADGEVVLAEGRARGLSLPLAKAS